MTMTYTAQLGHPEVHGLLPPERNPEREVFPRGTDIVEALVAKGLQVVTKHEDPNAQCLAYIIDITLVAPMNVPRFPDMGHDPQEALSGGQFIEGG